MVSARQENQMSNLEETLEAIARMLCVEVNTGSWITVFHFHNKFHRDFDKPAIIWADGDKEWYQHGKCHRDHDKPAMVYDNGTKYWFQHGNEIKYK